MSAGRGRTPMMNRRPMVSRSERGPTGSMPATGPGDAAYAFMSRHPNPEPPEWARDPSKLPKRPPGRS